MSKTRYIISDAAKMIDVEPHVLRYWEEELGMEIPRNEMGHRYYTDREVKLFTMVRDLKDKGFQLKAIKMILTAVSGETNSDNIISLEEVRKTYGENEEAPEQDVHLEEEAKDSDEIQDLTEPVKDEAEDVQLPAADSGETTVQVLTPEEKMGHFKYMMDGIVMQALLKNNKALEDSLVSHISDKVIKEMDYLFRVQEEREEERYRNVDEIIRKKQRGRREAAASKILPYGPKKQKRGLFKSREF